MIQVDKLTKYYDNQTVLQNVTFRVDAGETFGVLGPRGAGKTTLMRILTTYLPPSDGLVTVAGYNVFSHSLEVRKRVGYLPQLLSLYTDMTVQDYLDYVAALHKVEYRTNRVAQVLTELNLSALAQRRIGNLSKGLRRYVGIAQAVIHDPEVLILDEPTAGLDPQQIVEMREFIKKLGQNRTIILSTRCLPEAEQICSRALILKKGQVVAQDTPARLAARLEGGQTIRLQISSAPYNAAHILQSLEGVNRVLTINPGTFDIECGCGMDCRPAVADLVVQQQWGLLELQAVDVSLEDVFLELTAKSEVTV